MSLSILISKMRWDWMWKSVSTTWIDEQFFDEVNEIAVKNTRSQIELHCSGLQEASFLWDMIARAVCGVPINVSSNIFLFALSLWWCLRSYFFLWIAAIFLWPLLFQPETLNLLFYLDFFICFPKVCLGFLLSVLLSFFPLAPDMFFFPFIFSSLFSELNLLQEEKLLLCMVRKKEKGLEFDDLFTSAEFSLNYWGYGDDELVI